MPFQAHSNPKLPKKEAAYDAGNKDVKAGSKETTAVTTLLPAAKELHEPPHRWPTKSATSFMNTLQENLSIL